MLLFKVVLVKLHFRWMDIRKTFVTNWQSYTSKRTSL